MKRQICFLILISSFCIITLGQEVKKVKLIYGSQGVLLPVSAKCTPQGFEQSFYESLNFLTTYDDIFLAWFSFLYGAINSGKEYRERYGSTYYDCCIS